MLCNVKAKQWASLCQQVVSVYEIFLKRKAVAGNRLRTSHQSKDRVPRVNEVLTLGSLDMAGEKDRDSRSC